MRSVVLTVATLIMWYSSEGVGAVPPEEDLNRSVYQINASECGPEHTGRLLTGFRANLANKSGLITALHGVVGCANIRADNLTGHFPNLQVLNVNVQLDVAFLTSDTMHESVSPVLRSSDATRSRSLKVL